MKEQVEGVNLDVEFFQLKAFLNKLDPVAIIWGIVLGVLRGQRIERGLFSLPSLFVQEAVRRINDRCSHLFSSPIAPGNVFEGRKKFLAAIQEIYNWDSVIPKEEKEEKRARVIELLKEALELYDHGGKVQAVRVCWILLELVASVPA